MQIYSIEMKEKDIVNKDTSKYNGKIRTIGKLGRDVEGAKSLFVKMKENNVVTDAVTYSIMIDVVGKIGRDVDGAKNLFAEIVGPRPTNASEVLGRAWGK